MENKDKGLTVPKCMMIVWPKIPQMPQNLSVQFVCPSPNVLDFIEKRHHWASVVRALIHTLFDSVTTKLSNTDLGQCQTTKGQLISKGLFAILNSSKNRTKKFDLNTMIPQVGGVRGAILYCRAPSIV